MITCNDLETFIECCAGLTRQGITFTADALRLTITCTGF